MATGLTSVHGVDFSGAKLAGRTTWLARLEPDAGAWALASLERLEDACGTAEREPALAHLVGRIRESRRALWALDFPFGLPVELVGPSAGWRDQLSWLNSWGEDGYGLGLECVRRSESLGGRKHIRRQTDVEEQAPFDPYHYRIIYQTFHGMRDVLRPLAGDRETAILPFGYAGLGGARRVLVEACPASTLRRLGLPSQNYKQPEGGALAARRRAVRRVILAGLSAMVRFSPAQARAMLRDPGGDALDAVLAAVGAARSWRTTDHRLVAAHPRYPREGRLYVG
jgi:hypothetical protein